MNFASKLFCRVFQGAFHLALPLLPYREPALHSSTAEVPQILKEKNITAVLLVTDQGLRAGAEALAALLEEGGIRCALYSGTNANPTVDNVEEALALYRKGSCQGLIAYGGGSPMDCAKAVGARVVYPKKQVGQMKGLLRVLRRLPLLIAIPTTAGTGSEVTVTAVITDPVHKHKYTMNNFSMIPRHAVLDPKVTLSLPPHLTATTGMDALTHAVEAYIGGSTSKETRRLALEAVGLIFENIEKAYRDGSDLTARAAMLQASYKAGIAFSKSYVGYIHAVAHSLGGQYNIPHGLANAVLMPYVLEDYGAAAHKKLAQLAAAAGITGETDRQAAEKFIAAIRELNRRMGIPATLPGIKKEDIPQMAAHAAKEANPLYPVPKLMNAKELQRFYNIIGENL
ncbi:MAG: iron-containing alcohol dehydrogenase [Clostridia bacterium]|nr:iron-containing alcohol dehydrogenase [Clostridia bacterium]